MSNPSKHSSILDGLSLENFKHDQPAQSARVERNESNKPTKSETALFRTTIIMDRKIHEVLREIAFTERTSITALVMEGLDGVLKTRRHPSTRELAAKP